MHDDTIHSDTAHSDAGSSPAGQTHSFDRWPGLGDILLAHESLETIMEMVVSLALRSARGSDAASLALTRDGAFQRPVATDPAMVELDGLQYQAGGTGVLTQLATARSFG